jgi:hypothetical protein
MHVYTHYDGNVPCRRHKCALWCGVRYVHVMIDWRRHKTAPVHLRGTSARASKKRVTTLVIFHHTPGPFVRLPAGIMTTMKTPDAATRENKWPGFVCRGALETQKSAGASDTHKSLMAEINHANLISAVELKLISVAATRGREPEARFGLQRRT